MTIKGRTVGAEIDFVQSSIDWTDVYDDFLVRLLNLESTEISEIKQMDRINVLDVPINGQHRG
jgi:hypothetical protein